MIGQLEADLERDFGTSDYDSDMQGTGPEPEQQGHLSESGKTYQHLSSLSLLMLSFLAYSYVSAYTYLHVSWYLFC